MTAWIVTKVMLDRDKNETSRFEFMETTTDSRGNVLDETEYHEDGSVSSKHIYRYFDDGTVKEYVEYNPFDELLERHVHIANEDGDVETILYEYGDGHKVTRTFRYTELGLADTATLRDEKGAILGYETSVFNENGDVIERVEFDEKHIETLKHLAEYDDDGNVLEEKKFVDGILNEITSYAYDLHGNVTRKTARDAQEGHQTIDEYRYDEQGNMEYNASFHNGVLIFENKCTYDADGNLKTEEFFEIDRWDKKVIRHEKLLYTSR